MMIISDKQVKKIAGCLMFCRGYTTVHITRNELINLFAYEFLGFNRQLLYSVFMTHFICYRVPLVW